MSFRVLLFAGLADTAGRREIVLDLPVGATVREAIQAVESVHPELAAQLDSAAVAIDECYVQRDAVLRDGCTLALIPPVSGG